MFILMAVLKSHVYLTFGTIYSYSLWLVNRLVELRIQRQAYLHNAYRKQGGDPRDMFRRLKLETEMYLDTTLKTNSVVLFPSMVRDKEITKKETNNSSY